MLKLHQNMRIQSGLDNQQFAEWIGRMSYDSDLYGVRPLPFMIINRYETPRSFIDHVYPPHDLAQAHTSSNFFRGRAILCPHNNFVNLLNRQIMNGFPESARLFTSVDTIENNDIEEAEDISTKYLQTLEPSGFPLSQMYLKVGASIMLLRNLHPHEGMCNGTRLIITHLH
jgi:ATP-dependent DNA helicase PIF1